MIFAFGSVIWHIVLDLIGIIVAIILLYIIGVAVYTIYQQYIAHRKMKKLKIADAVYKKLTKNGKKDGDDNGTQKNR